MNPPDRNKALIEAYFKDYSTGDISRIGSYLHEHLSYWIAGSTPGISGTYTKPEMLALLQQVTGVYKQGALHIWPVSMIGEGELLAVEAEATAELHNGRVYHNYYHFLFEIEGDRIKRIREYFDTQHVVDTFIAE